MQIKLCSERMLHMSQGEAGYSHLCSERMLRMSQGEAGYRVSYVVRECCVCHRGRLDTE